MKVPSVLFFTNAILLLLSLALCVESQMTRLQRLAHELVMVGEQFGERGQLSFLEERLDGLRRGGWDTKQLESLLHRLKQAVKSEEQEQKHQIMGYMLRRLADGGA